MEITITNITSQDMEALENFLGLSQPPRANEDSGYPIRTYGMFSAPGARAVDEMIQRVSAQSLHSSDQVSMAP